MRLTDFSKNEPTIGNNRASSLTACSPAHFAGLMAACGPFETTPHLAVGVSGGPDSLALMLLLADWVRAKGGKLTALTVDHGLRQDSAAEAELVARWAAQAGIDHRILTWKGAKPHAGIQAAARRARYDLLTAWCRDAEVLHLAIGHQEDDQRETVAMRRARSEADGAGNAGINLITVRQGIRLLRPLLPVGAEVLKTYLRGRGQIWIADPSNQLERFERVRWRRGLEGPLPVPSDIRAWGEARQKLEEAVADLLARSVCIHEAGFVLADFSAWRRADSVILPQALGQLVAMVAGRDYLPPRAALKKAVGAAIAGAATQTLGGALIGTWRKRGLICREAAAVKQNITASGAARFLWDRRFQVEVMASGAPVRIGPLGEKGIAEIGGSGLFRLKEGDIPAPARASLPALRDATGRLIAVPHLGFDPYGKGSRTHLTFRPHYSATSSGFTVAYGWPHTI